MDEFDLDGFIAGFFKVVGIAALIVLAMLYL
jgi:hypothetical protein